MTLASRPWTRFMSLRGTRSMSPGFIVLALAHNYERLKEVPSDETNGIGVVDVGDQYARGTRSSYALAMDSLARIQRHSLSGPSRGCIGLIPPAIASGLGELGKHGSLYQPQNSEQACALAGVTTDMPLVATSRTASAADEFCSTCRFVQPLPTRRNF